MKLTVVDRRFLAKAALKAGLAVDFPLWLASAGEAKRSVEITRTTVTNSVLRMKLLLHLLFKFSRSTIGLFAMLVRESFAGLLLCCFSRIRQSQDKNGGDH